MDLLINIVIPLLSALIGGGMTLLGVWLTLKYQREKDDEINKLKYKPFFYETLPSENDRLNSRQIQLVSNEHYSMKNLRQIPIRNSDNGVLLIEYLKTENKIYKPLYGKIVEKNAYCVLCVYFDDGENLKNMLLSVTDVLGNRYMYDVDQNEKNISGIPDFIIKEQ